MIAYLNFSQASALCNDHLYGAIWFWTPVSTLCMHRLSWSRFPCPLWICYHRLQPWPPKLRLLWCSHVPYCWNFWKIPTLIIMKTIANWGTEGLDGQILSIMAYPWITLFDIFSIQKYSTQRTTILDSEQLNSHQATCMTWLLRQEWSNLFNNFAFTKH